MQSGQVCSESSDREDADGFVVEMVATRKNQSEYFAGPAPRQNPWATSGLSIPPVPQLDGKSGGFIQI